MYFYLIFMFLSFAHAQNLEDFTVFSKGDINYAKSDFEGLVGAGGSVRVQNFLFKRASSGENGLLVGNVFIHEMGSIVAETLKVGVRVDLTKVDITKKRTNLIVPKARLENVDLRGSVIATDITSITSNIQNEIGINSDDVRNLQNFLDAEFRFVSSSMDNLSSECLRVGGRAPLRIYDQLIIKATVPGRNVFFLSEKDLSEVNQITLSAVPNANIIINSDAQFISLRKVGMRIEGDLQVERVLWNFAQASEVVLESTGSAKMIDGRPIGIPGTVLAPHANVKFLNGALTGSMWVKSLEGVDRNQNGGQVNYRRYSGSCRQRGGKG